MKNKIKKFITDKDLFKAPVDVVKLAEAYEFKIFQQELDYDGAIICKEDDGNDGIEINGQKYNKVILINVNQTATRKRFTIAHELIHWLFADEKDKKNLYAHRDDNLTNFNHEPEINSYASELLMPRDLIKLFLKEIGAENNMSPSVIYKVADAFNVSYAAAQVRLEKYQRGE